jgi:AmiR/NasT family two-component response regulator
MRYLDQFSDPTSRKAIDVAVGILVGLRGYSEREAFDELARVVRETGIGLSSTATALVALATGSSTPDHAEAFTAWGALLGRRYGAAGPARLAG